MLKAVTGDSDHYPLLADIPLDNISFVPPGPELPQPDRTARIKRPATQKQLHDYKMQTEMRVGQAARKEAKAMRKAIKMADETIGSKSPTERLRLNKKDEPRAAGLTKEMVLNYASKVSEMLKDVYDNVAHEVFEWTKPGPAKPTRYRNHKERRRWKDLHKYRAELKQALDAYKSKPRKQQTAGMRKYAKLSAYTGARQAQPSGSISHQHPNPLAMQHGSNGHRHAHQR